MIRVAIVEDNPADRMQIEQHTRRFFAENEEAVQIYTFGNGIDFLEHYRAHYDVIFLDIEMPLMDGMETAEKIRKLDPYVILIFVTNMSQLALKAYEVNAYDFIVKPMVYSAFDFKMRKVKRILDKRKRKFVMLPVKGALAKVSTDDIYYIEVENHRLYCHTKEGRFLLTAGSLSGMEEKLEGEHFCKCNSCYLVNLQHVTAVEKDFAVVKDVKLAISRAKKKGFIKALTDSVEEY